MKRLILGAAAAAVLAVPALAVEPRTTWTGWYVGANAGVAWGNSDLSSNFYCTGPTNTCPWNTSSVPRFAAFGAGASGSPTDHGFTGGAQAGYNWQTGQTVSGIEVDFNAFDLNPSVATTANIPGSTVLVYSSRGEASTNWILTLRGRLGWTISPAWLVYATGGLALTDLEIANSYQDNASIIGGGRPNIAGASSSRSLKAGCRRRRHRGGAERALVAQDGVSLRRLWLRGHDADDEHGTGVGPDESERHDHVGRSRREHRTPRPKLSLALTRQGSDARLGSRRENTSRPVSRVLSGSSEQVRGPATAIHLGRTLLRASSDQPGWRVWKRTWRPALPRTPGHPYLVLLPVGFALPRPSPDARCALTAPFHPYL